MQTRAFLAAVLGLSLLSAPVTAQSAGPAPNRQFAQADKKSEDEAEQKDRRGPGRSDVKGKGSDRSFDRSKDAGKDAENARREAMEKAKAARDAAAKAKADQEAKSRAEADAKAKAEADAKAKAAADTKAKAEADVKAKAAADAKAKAEADAKAKATADAKAKAEPDAKAKAATGQQQRQLAPQQQQQQQQQTQDRDRDDRRERFSRERRRGGDEEREARERAQRREEQRTPAQELSKVQVQQGRATQIDGGRRTLERDGNRIVIRTDDTSRFTVRGDRRGNERVERLPNGQTRTIVIYPDGSQIVTITDARGAIVHRSRRGRDGREIVYFREVKRPPLVKLDLGPLRVTIPRNQYVVDSRRASRADLQRVFFARPVERVNRIYTIDEVRRFDRVRDIMPRLDFHTITFDSDSAFISPQQVDQLAGLADIIHELIQRNPAEVVLIEGHTDLVGSDVYNLALADRRAEAVAIALTDYFDVPPENLVTQGYGESFPLIPTEAAERENRRVAFRRITPLVSEYGR